MTNRNNLLLSITILLLTTVVVGIFGIVPFPEYETSLKKDLTKKIICSDSWMLAQTRIIEPSINKIISSKTLSPTKSETRIIVPIDIVVDDKKYPSQLGFMVFE